MGGEQVGRTREEGGQMEKQGRLGTNARARTGHIAGHGERVESNDGSERSREGRSMACASAWWNARGTGGMGARRPTRGAFFAGRFGATTGAGRAPLHPSRQNCDRSGPTASPRQRIAGTNPIADRPFGKPPKTTSREPRKRGRGSAGTPLGGSLARPSPLYFWKRARRRAGSSHAARYPSAQARDPERLRTTSRPNSRCRTTAATSRTTPSSPWRT